MKTIKLLAMALLISLSAVAQAQTKTKKAKSKKAATAMTTKKVDVDASKITWIGKKVTGQHEGTIKLQNGVLIFSKNTLRGGNFTMDMNSISATDLQGEWKVKLDGHLKDNDFFGTKNHPTSKLKFKTITDKGNGVYGIVADLTIKNITNPISFDLTVGQNSANTTLKIDRTKYDIKYNSGKFFDSLGDKTISDEFELNVSLVF